ncbi:MAG: hypothetical protein NUW01_01685 [Gemmatimonadaceae bacterium]|nr:hypothetical protein [Gemmatimonadaceae bacterium]
MSARHGNGGTDPGVCVFEAKLALMRAALHACTSQEARDDEAAAVWRGRADYAREMLRVACDYRDARLAPAQLSLLEAA